MLNSAGFEVERMDLAPNVLKLPYAIDAEPPVIDSEFSVHWRGVEVVDGVSEGGGRIFIVAMDPSPGQMENTRELGADSVVLSTEELGALVVAMRLAMRGTESEQAESSNGRCEGAWGGASMQSDDHALLARLSPREQAVLGYLVEGLSAVEIAETSHVAVSTIRSHIRSILIKLEVRSQLAAVAMAHRVGWIAAL